MRALGFALALVGLASGVAGGLLALLFSVGDLVAPSGWCFTASLLFLVSLVDA